MKCVYAQAQSERRERATKKWIETFFFCYLVAVAFLPTYSDTPWEIGCKNLNARIRTHTRRWFMKVNALKLDLIMLFAFSSVRIGSFWIDFYLNKMCNREESKKKTLLKIKFYREGKCAIPFEEENEAKYPRSNTSNAHTQSLCVIKSTQFWRGLRRWRMKCTHFHEIYTSLWIFSASSSAIRHRFSICNFEFNMIFLLKNKTSSAHVIIINQTCKFTFWFKCNNCWAFPLNGEHKLKSMVKNVFTRARTHTAIQRPPCKRHRRSWFNDCFNISATHTRCIQKCTTRVHCL